jgi:hypothetical protein
VLLVAPAAQQKDCLVVRVVWDCQVTKPKVATAALGRIDREEEDRVVNRAEADRKARVLVKIIDDEVGRPCRRCELKP